MGSKQEPELPQAALSTSLCSGAPAPFQKVITDAKEAKAGREPRDPGSQTLPLALDPLPLLDLREKP